MHNYPLPRADVGDFRYEIDEDSPQVEDVGDTPQVAHHNLASDDVAPLANLLDTPPPLEVETRAPLLAVGARVGDEADVVAAAGAPAVVAAAGAPAVVAVAGAERRPRCVPRQPS